MQAAAELLITSLREEQKSKALFSFEVEERFNFQFTPVPRKGLRFDELEKVQQAQLISLLKSVLSEEGYQKARNIMSLELILRIIENRPPNDARRHPEQYFISIFGKPDTEKPWGWRFEGHHMSLNFTSVDKQLSITPSFMGSNPGIVPDNIEGKAGWEVLDKEQNLARAFVKSLSDADKEKTILLESAPDEILTGIERKVKEMPIEGLSYAEMTEAHKLKFLELLDVYLGNMVPKIASTQLAKIKKAGFDKLHFLWGGGIEKGEAHYYRIHGPTVLIEYDNIQTNANHVHTVLRDLTDDFGDDLLSKHYRESDHHH